MKNFTNTLKKIAWFTLFIWVVIVIEAIELALFALPVAYLASISPWFLLLCLITFPPFIITLNGFIDGAISKKIKWLSWFDTLLEKAGLC